MNDPKPSAPLDPPAWDPPPEALDLYESIDSADARPGTLVLDHLGHPFVLALEDSKPGELQRAALAYLDAVRQRVPALNEQIPPKWLADLRQPDAPQQTFGWTDLAWPLPLDGEEVVEPYGSFRVGAIGLDHHVALYASERVGDRFIGSGFGLRVVLRVRRQEVPMPQTVALIDGLVACLPFGVYRSAGLASKDWRSITVEELRGLVGSFRTRIEALVELREVRVRALRLARPEGGPLRVEWRGVGLQGAGAGTAYAFAARGTDKSVDVVVRRTPLVADGMPDRAPVPRTPAPLRSAESAVTARVFDRDPASCDPVPAAPPGEPPPTVRSRRPGRVDALLEPYRIDITIPGTAGTPVPLEDSTRVKVLVCPRYVRADRAAPAGTTRQVGLPAGAPELRSDDASAVQGLHHARELFRRLQAYGIDPDAYFRVARPELHLAYRSGVSPGPGKDGQSINARVLPRGWPSDLIGPTPIRQRPLLELHLSLADRSRRSREPWTPATGRMPAQPLGIGADPRWIWHEFGHVLLMATTGELELRFAHSPGDALAAIVSDPLSTLRGTRDRYATFPWVFLTRRHDRCTLLGWSWCGPMHAGLAHLPDDEQPRRKGYLSEQILSTSLFRLYRCLGGDAADPATRLRASHYTVYLLMRALELLGDARLVPARTPQDLVLALRLADRCTGAWEARYPPGSVHRRHGGCAVKAVRWAFEAQGLYGTPGDTGPGAPPPVDVYIASRRPDAEATPCGEIVHGPGNYQPVPLDWTAADGAPPHWQAADGAMRVRGDGMLVVEVGNRGRDVARAVSVELRWIAWPDSQPHPAHWDPAAWTLIASTPAQDVPAGRPVEFGPFPLPSPGGRHVLLAIAHCEADRAHVDPATGYECATAPTPVIDLVANDNNLGLKVLR